MNPRGQKFSLLHNRPHHLGLTQLRIKQAQRPRLLKLAAVLHLVSNLGFSGSIPLLPTPRMYSWRGQVQIYHVLGERKASVSIFEKD
jgi:hypothetical protein